MAETKAYSKDILTLEEASELFQVSSKTFLKLLREEALPARKVGREWRFSKAALLQWVTSGNSQNYIAGEEENKAYFTEVAPVYDELRKGCYGNALAEILVTKTPLQADFTVADLGTGTGYLAKVLARHTQKVVAVDISTAMLEVAGNEFVREGFTNIELVEGNAHDLPLPEASQDRVFANLLLHHLLDPALGIKEMGRILKPGGWAIISDIVSHQQHWLKKEKFDLWLGFEPAELKEWFGQAGFREIKVDKLACNCRTSNKEGKVIELPMVLALGQKPLK